MKLVEAPENITLTLNNFVINDVPDDEFVIVNFLNPTNVITNGLNGLTVVRRHPSSDAGTLEVKVPIGSNSYAFFINAKNSIQPVIFNGELRVLKYEVNANGVATDVTEVFALKGGAMTEVQNQTVIGTSSDIALISFTIQFRSIISTVSNNI